MNRIIGRSNGKQVTQLLLFWRTYKNSMTFIERYRFIRMFKAYYPGVKLK